MTFEKILDKYRKISTSEVDKGTRFEVLMKNFLLTYPEYRGKFICPRTGKNFQPS